MSTPIEYKILKGTISKYNPKLRGGIGIVGGYQKIPYSETHNIIIGRILLNIMMMNSSIIHNLNFHFLV